ncbi:MAG TPA: DUF2490 domain-containing protein, partial [Hymenobacter sp.]
QYNGDHHLGPNWALHTEYQARRVRLGRDWQQRLARIGLVYQVLPRVQVSAGYTSFITHPFGRYPTASTGVPYPERRLHQDVQLSDTVGRVVLTHRLRLEQRWIGQLAEGGSRDVQAWQYQNRIRYQLAATLPLQGRTLDDGEWYLNAFDELFMGFGRAVNLNVFNQNRISGGLGYQVNEDFQVELNYLNQITQHGDPDPASGLPVVEFNHGFILGVAYNFTFWK